MNGPIAGYYGTLTASNDIALLEHVARELPEVCFVFVGAVTAGDYRALQALPNTRFLGFLPYERMAELAASFDVCLLPWLLSDWIRHCNPLKLMEYLAAGKPVVSVAIPQVEAQAGELVRIAKTPEDFAQAIREELERDEPELRSRRMELARRHSWSAHGERPGGHARARPAGGPARGRLKPSPAVASADAPAPSSQPIHSRRRRHTSRKRLSRSEAPGMPRAASRRLPAMRITTSTRSIPRA